MRTREQIVADCEKRFEELQVDAEDPRKKYPCTSCRWHRARDRTCHEPLVKGLGRPPKCAEWFLEDRFDLPKGVAVCGPEKALWQPKPTLCQRIMQFLYGDAA